MGWCEVERVLVGQEMCGMCVVLCLFMELRVELLRWAVTSSCSVYKWLLLGKPTHVPVH